MLVCTLRAYLRNALGEQMQQQYTLSQLISKRRAATLEARLISFHLQLQSDQSTHTIPVKATLLMYCSGLQKNNKMKFTVCCLRLWCKLKQYWLRYCVKLEWGIFPSITEKNKKSIAPHFLLFQGPWQWLALRGVKQEVTYIQCASYISQTGLDTQTFLYMDTWRTKQLQKWWGQPWGKTGSNFMWPWQQWRLWEGGRDKWRDGVGRKPVADTWDMTLNWLR